MKKTLEGRLDSGSYQRKIHFEYDTDLAESADEKLKLLYDFCNSVITSAKRDRDTGILASPFYLAGSLSEDALQALVRLSDDVEKKYPLVLRPVFEDGGFIQNVTCDAWGREEIIGGPSQALIKMRFVEGTKNLPLHVHPYSDRVLMVREGEGFAYHSLSSSDNFTPESIRRVPFKPGSIFCYPENTIHTFESTRLETLTMTFHAPWVPFNDERNIGKTGNWYPSMWTG